MIRTAGNSCVRILGPIEAWSDGRRLELGGPRQLALFAFLLVHANRAIASDVLRDALWGPSRSGSHSRLQMAVARLRKSLAPLDGPAGLALRTVHGGYLLSLAPGQLDAEVFADRLQYGLHSMQAGQPKHSTAALGEALSLWRGPPLAEVAFEDFAQGEIRRLHELRRAALETRMDAELRLGRHRELIGDLRRLSAEHPTCERIAAQLMLALYRSDRQADALEVYDRTRVQLSAQLGLAPGPTLNALQANILTHAPSLIETTDAALPRGPRPLVHTPLTPGPTLTDGQQPNDVSAPLDAHRETPAVSSARAARVGSTSAVTAIRWQGPAQHWQRQAWVTASPGQVCVRNSTDTAHRPMMSVRAIGEVRPLGAGTDDAAASS
jgi:DNA-binding SARP family transcriptional activator